VLHYSIKRSTYFIHFHFLLFTPLEIMPRSASNRTDWNF
jgi:hypothetical protein